ncbi:uncharacterized protein [Glycine max]|uniref:uncharacterized protein n=1 Tax=Glycine max TaxID=3847 RepID=UPI0003DED523|nr:uncharacterized protein LOC102670517 [Glycine max]|eukprot:XP_006584218.1 uncharacterized protein LOC102670517 [Glycine max]
MYAGERFKCAKFINSLRPEVKMMVNYHGMHNFAQLTNMRRIFHEDQREKVAFYRNANASHGKKKKHVTHSCAKLYSSLLGQYGVNPAGRDGGGASVALAMPSWHGKCGKMSHFAHECPDNDVTCFNYRAVTHSFISRVCVEKLALPVSSLKFNLIMDTPASGPVLTSDIDVILGMDWLSSNHVLLNYCEKSVVFLEFGVSEGDMFLSANLVEASLREDAQVYMILASMSVETKTPMSDITLVREFSKVFEEMSGLPPEREVEFSIDLVPGTGPISIAPYRMSPVELSELKKQFVRPNVSP